MYRLKHCVLFADICASRGANAALELCRFIGYNVTVEVGKKEYLEIRSALLVNKLCGHNVGIPLVCGDLGVKSGYLVAILEEIAVGGFNNICLCDKKRVYVRSFLRNRKQFSQFCPSPALW